ncbi:hypothetical protein EVAR_48877_1 [Eumeta japonica]|uniref:Uncharacterized protein n=1 Tax=Eumeta variegata TaxID=151549 RepID=A0A4C1Y7W7_EUMVA|nr:hypothetical protein EVAR_48877_1 [Eumeta japonica]
MCRFVEHCRAPLIRSRGEFAVNSPRRRSLAGSICFEGGGAAAAPRAPRPASRLNAHSAIFSPQKDTLIPNKWEPVSLNNRGRELSAGCLCLGFRLGSSASSILLNFMPPSVVPLELLVYSIAGEGDDFVEFPNDSPQRWEKQRQYSTSFFNNVMRDIVHLAPERRTLSNVAQSSRDRDIDSRDVLPQTLATSPPDSFSKMCPPRWALFLPPL